MHICLGKLKCQALKLSLYNGMAKSYATWAFQWSNISQSYARFIFDETMTQHVSPSNCYQIKGELSFLPNLVNKVTQENSWCDKMFEKARIGLLEYFVLHIEMVEQVFEISWKFPRKIRKKSLGVSPFNKVFTTFSLKK